MKTAVEELPVWNLESLASKMNTISFDTRF